MAEEDFLEMHRLINRFETVYPFRSMESDAYHLKLRVVSTAAEHVDLLVAFLVLSIQERDTSELSIHHYLDGDALHILVGFLDKTVALRRVFAPENLTFTEVRLEGESDGGGEEEEEKEEGEEEEEDDGAGASLRETRRPGSSSRRVRLGSDSGRATEPDLSDSVL